MTITLKGAPARALAAESPANPAPMMTTRRRGSFRSKRSIIEPPGSQSMRSSVIRGRGTTAISRRKVGRRRFVENYTFDWIEFFLPRGTFQNSRRTDITCIPSHPDARRAEIDVLGVTLVIESHSQQCYDMHAGDAAIAG